MAAVRFTTGWRRFIPVIGYHHVLMILIAIAIILLCESKLSKAVQTAILTSPSPPVGRLLINIRPHTRHILDLPLLPTIPTRFFTHTSRPGRHNCNSKHRR